MNGPSFFPGLNHAVWIVVVGGPLLTAAVLAVPRLRRIAIWLAPWTAAPAVAVALFGPHGGQATFDALLLGARFAADPVARVFLLFTGLLWLVAGFYAQSYLRDDPRKVRFFAFFLAAMAGNLGLEAAQDMPSFYALFALMTFASYGLVLHTGSKEARHASRVYIVMAILGEAALFTAMVTLASASDTLIFSELDFANLPSASRNLATVLAMIGLGVKVGVIGIHMWLPLAHPAAPTPASAVLSGAMIKAGVVGWMRFLPVGQVDLPEAGAAVIVVGLTGAVAAVLFGLSQTNPKTVLAYSSVSQMGLITIALGLGMRTAAAWPAAMTAVLLYALHHSLAKGALFLGVGVAAALPRAPVTRGLVRIGLLLPAVALAGAPFTSGSVAKTALKGVAEAASGGWAGALEILLPLTAVGTTVIMSRFLLLVWRPKEEHRGSLPPTMALSWAALVVLSGVVIWVWPSWLIASILGKALEVSKMWTLIWPILAGIALSTIVARSVSIRARFQDPVVPAGDLLIPMGRLGVTLYAIGKNTVGRIRSATVPVRAKALELSSKLTIVPHQD
jgi:formate hydrogenlyase subunit 3/multisubunit Na+/H+ antiporter MnhD subunit